MSKPIIHGMGWMPELPDCRDYSIESESVKTIFENANMSQNPLLFSNHKKTNASEQALTISAKVDLRAWCSPVEDQGQIGSCTANAGVGLMEYFQRRAFGIYLDGSRLFLYKVTRNLLKWTGDTGAYLRSTMKAMAAFGVCPEEYWPYSDIKTGQNGISSDPFEKEPSSFSYQFANNYKSSTYFRLDPAGATPSAILANVKNNIASGLPSMFGFTVYSSISEASSNGKIPYPKAGDSVQGGHAVVAIGYDDNMTIQNGVGGPKTKGAFIIRNSWGPLWGENGYGYLPYEYVLKGQAKDFWTMVNAGFFNTNNF